MKKQDFSKRVLFCLSVMAMVGCTDDPAEPQTCDCEKCQACDEKENCTCDKDCPDKPGTDQPGTDDPGTDQPDAKACADQTCTPGETRCDAKQVVVCKADEDGCGY